MASLVDAGVLWGIRSFMQLLSGESPFALWEWIVVMIALAALRFFFLFWKTRLTISFLYNTSAQTTSWFLRTLRSLSPRIFHNSEGDALVETAYESTQVLQNNGEVFFQAIQAVLQLAIFFPVLLYISWPLTLFLFAIVVPMVAFMQRRLHAMGPEEESLLFLRSKFRTDLNLARRLYRKWSCNFERTAVTDNLQKAIKNLNARSQKAGVKKNGLALATETISVLSMVFVLAFCALLISHGWMDSTGLVLFCSAVLLSYKPVKECARVMPQFRSAMSAYRVLAKFGELPQKTQGKPAVHDTAPSGCSVTTKNNVPHNASELTIRDASFGYALAEKNVYTNLNICFNENKPVLLRGQNGTGKSTLLRLIAGLEEWESGSMDHLAKSRKAGIFFVAQDLELPPKELLMVLLERNVNETVEKFIETAGVRRLLEKNGLSGGERAKVALTWALASKSAVLLLDEPFAAVALVDREPLLNTFLDCAQTLDKWVMIASHDAMSEQLIARFNIMEMK
ncbi:MAG: ATP-binding cassette domain-containing protein [Fibrobacter sp.]|nr:ATP-binding cassette domain-containing protein [Fibrobacter sp.]